MCTNNIAIKVDDRIHILNKNLRQYKNHDDTLPSSTVRTTLDQIHENFVVFPIDKATNNFALICKRNNASVITKELGFSNNEKTSTYKEINDLSYNHIVNNFFRKRVWQRLENCVTFSALLMV